jgi:hypothetical protein
MNVSVDMPTNEAEVPGAIAKIDAQIKTKRAELDALCAFRKAMQSMCSHPRKFYRSDAYGGGGDCHCPDCGWMS